MNPYPQGKCWYHVGSGTRRNQKTVVCGLDARQYLVTKTDNGGTLTRSFSLHMWLCAIHKGNVESNGYILTLTSGRW